MTRFRPSWKACIGRLSSASSTHLWRMLSRFEADAVDIRTTRQKFDSKAPQFFDTGTLRGSMLLAVQGQYAGV